MSAYKPRILVIDDEPQMHRFLGPALGAAGFEALRADCEADGVWEFLFVANGLLVTGAVGTPLSPVAIK